MGKIIGSARVHRWTPPTDPIAFFYKTQNLGKTFSARKSPNAPVCAPLSQHAGMALLDDHGLPLRPFPSVRGAHDQIRADSARGRSNASEDVERVVDTILNEIEATLARADRVELRGFGAFTVKTWSARPGRNPKTGDPINVPETRHPSFRTGKEMRDRLNGTPGSALRAAFHKT